MRTWWHVHSWDGERIVCHGGATDREDAVDLAEITEAPDVLTVEYPDFTPEHCPHRKEGSVALRGAVKS